MKNKGRQNKDPAHLIAVALGSNLPSRFGPPRQTCEAALKALEKAGLRVVRRSRWYESAPVPASDQPWFVNGVAAVETDLAPEELMERLHGVERTFGRVRGERNGPRIIDLDLLCYGDRVLQGKLVLPHPRMEGRAFVLLPLAELAPDWHHPASGASIADLIRELPKDQDIRAVD